MVDLLAHAAVSYAADLHMPVFPTNGKVPLLAGGFKSATTDPAEVRTLWQRHPHANVAAATGLPGWALDVDPRHGGDTALAALEREHGPLPDTWRYQTPGGGVHIWFAHDPRITTARGHLPTGLDVRGSGGYVILPPSVGPDPETRYTWLIGFSPDDVSLAPAPTWLLELICRPVSHEADTGTAPILPGDRHMFLLRQGGRLAGIGMDEAAIHAALAALNRTRCAPPLPDGRGDEGWERLLPQIFAYAKRERTTRRAHAETARGPVEDLTGTTTSPLGDDWPELLPLEASTVPPFPLQVFPLVLADVVRDIAAVTHTPLDFAGLAALAVMGTIASRRVDVAIGRTHVEPLNLYTMLIADSGERKGPVHRAGLAPLFALERHLQQEAAPAITKAKEKRKLEDKRLERLRDQGAREDDETERQKIEDEIVALALKLTAVPPMPLLVISDRTVEQLEIELMQQDGAVLLASEEAGTLLSTMSGRYARDGWLRLDTYLKAYDRGEIDVARISRAAVRCSTPELSLFITPQRTILRQLRAHPEFHDRGLLPRFLFSLPPSPVGTRPTSTMPPTPLIRAAYEVLVATIAKTWPRQRAGNELPHLELVGPSWDCWASYYTRVEHELLDDGVFGAIKEWGNKQPGRVARLAGLLHLATHPDSTSRGIDVATIAAACELGQYFEAHALATYDLIGTLPTFEGARRIVAWLRRQPKPVTTFTEREVAQAFRAGSAGRFFSTLNDLRGSLHLLVEYGYLRQHIPDRQGQPGRPPGPTFTVRPGIYPTRHQNHQKGGFDGFDDGAGKFPPDDEEVLG